MRNEFDTQLRLLNKELLEMSALIERAIESASAALIRHDVAAAKAIIAADGEVNRKERDIETLCIRLLLRQQPVARDLRLISAAMKMITDMERIGDHAADISEIVVYLAQESYIKEPEHLSQMASAAITMVTGSLDAYVNKDLTLARDVILMDDVIDDLFSIIKSELTELIRKNGDCGTQAIDMLMIAKYFERIGDHAQNIAEWVEYSMTGKYKGEYL